MNVQTPVHESFQIILAEDTTHFSLWSRLIIPEISFKTIGIENHGPSTKSLLQAIRIQHRLLPPNIGVLACLFSFHYSQGETISSKEYIIYIPFLSRYARHTFHFIFFPYILERAIKNPPFRLHIHININLTGLELGNCFRIEMTFSLILFLFGS